MRNWPGTPGRVRTIGPAYRPEDGADRHSSGAGLGAWFDAVRHSQQVTPVRWLPAGGR
ncbi:hypothetical protein GCM10022416_23110 [Actinomadura keratinilytica]|uniref:Uncharacterized protein n=1 Tax=Actinomadura keratinilytica TaxID=547461 RepID=A0ABP7YLH0_9ACTN